MLQLRVAGGVVAAAAVASRVPGGLTILAGLVAGAAALAAGHTAARRGRRAVWSALGAVLVLDAVSWAGGAARAVLGTALPVARYLALTLAVALLLTEPHRVAGRSRPVAGGWEPAAALDAAMLVTAGAAALGAVLVPAQVTGHQADPATLIASAVPFADLVAAGAVTFGLLSGVVAGRANRWLALWLFAVLVVDTVNAATPDRVAGITTALALGYTAAGTVVLLAALDPSAVQPLRGRPEDGDESTPVPLRMAVLWLAGMAGPAALLGHAVQRREVDIALVALLVAATMTLMLARLLRLLRQVQSQAAALHRLSGTDALTGLANRRAWEDSFAAVCRRAVAAGEDVAVLMIDLDHFKAYNDERGHLAGDRLLQAVVRSWRAALRPGDLLARWGGEEFAACLPGCDSEEARAVGLRLLHGMPQGQTTSVGIAVLAPGESPASLVERADAALYAAKREGRARVVVAPGQPG